MSYADPMKHGTCRTKGCGKRAALTSLGKQTYCSACRRAAWDRNRRAEGLDPVEVRRQQRNIPRETRPEKICTGCRQLKPKKDYYVRSNGRPQSKCKECYNRDRQVGSGGLWTGEGTAYGIPLKELRKIFLDQGERCACCKTQEFGARGPCVDHCHVTGVIRGILCNSCNAGLGLLGDTAEDLRRALTYLEKVLDRPTGLIVRAPRTRRSNILD